MNAERPMRFASRLPNPVLTEEYAAIRELVVRVRRRAGLSQRDLAAAPNRRRSCSP